jgi:molybdate transport system substrate-binding protein
MRRSTAALFALFVIVAAGAAAGAAEIATLSTNAIRGPLLALAEEFRKQTGDEVRIRFDTSTSIARRMAGGESADVLVSTTAAVEQAIKEGKAIAGSRVHIGKVPVGVAIRRGARRPDLSSVEALKASLVAAGTVGYSQGASGVYTERMLRDLGLFDRVKRVQTPTGSDMLQQLAMGTGNEIGLTQVSEIMEWEERGITLVGPLPEAVQYYTSFDAVVLSGARAPDAARAFVRAIAAPEARPRLSADGWVF